MSLFFGVPKRFAPAQCYDAHCFGSGDSGNVVRYKDIVLLYSLDSAFEINIVAYSI